MNLYELHSAFFALMNDIEAGRVDPQEEVEDAETGETLTLAEALDRLALDFDRKVENIGLWIKNLNAEAEAIRAEETALAKRRRTAERRAASLKGYLATALHGVKFSAPRVAISFRRSSSVEVDEEAATRMESEADARFCTAKWAVSKTLIKEALGRGESVPGAKIVETLSTIVK